MSDVRIEALLQWIDRHQKVFVPSSPVFRGNSIDNIKHCSELVLVASLLHGTGEHREWSSKILDALWNDAFQEGNYLRNLLLVRPDMLMAISTYTNFHECGYENRYIVNLAKAYSKAQWIDKLPIPFWRTLDIINSFCRLGLMEFPKCLKKRCWVSGKPPPAIVSIEIAYAITHEIFYITDFGRSTERLSTDEITYLHFALPFWQRYYQEKQDIDLCAEFVLAEWYALLSSR